MKKQFGIVEPFRFEMMDFYSLAQIVNVALIMTVGLVASWFGLAVAVLGLVDDWTRHAHVNAVLMRISIIVLNIYFLTLL